MKVLALFSGGMDSTTLLYWLRNRGYTVATLSINYGQRHIKELEYARAMAHRLGVAWDVLDIPKIGNLSKSALTGQIEEIPEGHYAQDNMSQTVVPFRNPTILSLGMMAAAGMGADYLATAVHAGDHYVYPDCRPAFTRAFVEMSKQALEGFPTPGLLTPFINMTKTAVAIDGGVLGVPWERTWSCYKGGDIHCGRCGTCVERLEALHDAAQNDPTEYADPDYWRTVEDPNA